MSFINGVKFFSLIFIFSLTLLMTGCSKKSKSIEGWWQLDLKVTAKIYKEIEENIPKKSRVSLPILKSKLSQMAKNNYLVFTKDKLIYISGYKKQIYPYTITEKNGEELTITANGISKKMIFNGYTLREKTPSTFKLVPITYRRVSSAEIKKIEQKIASITSNKPIASSDERIRFLVYNATPKQRADIYKNQKDIFNITSNFNKENALFFAIRKNNLDLLKEMVDAGANLKVKNSRKENLLFACKYSFNRKREIFDYLLKQGLNLKQTNMHKNTLLIEFIEAKNNLKSVKFLIKLGLDPNAKGTFDTALRAAFNNNQHDVVTYLVKEHGVDIKSVAKDLDKFVRNLEFEKLEYLLLKGIYKDSEKTALMMALGSHSSKVKKALPQFIELYSKQISELDANGENVLSYTNDIDTAKKLIAKGASYEGDIGTDIILHCASGNIKLLKYYIDDLKIPCDIKNKNYETALSYAVYYKNNLETVKYLIAKFKEKRVANQRAKIFAKALSCALNNSEYVDLLIDAGCDLKTTTIRYKLIESCIMKKNLKLLEHLVNKGMSLKTDPKEYYTPFLYAYFSRTPSPLDVVKVLVRLGADPLAKNANGKNALDLAKKWKKAEVVSYLQSL